MSYTLFAHQQEALNLSRDKEGYLYAHEMGLGKSCTALADAVRNQVQFLFVVAPVGVAQAWVVDHAPKYAPNYFKSSVYIQGGKIYDADGTLRQEKLETPLLIALNFEIIRGKRFAAFKDICKTHGPEGMIVVDESHRIKNPKAVVTKAINQLAPFFKFRRALTGTPIGNGHQDLYSQMKFVIGKEFPYKSFYSYALDFCNFGGFKNKQVVGDRNAHQLRALIAPYTHVAKKEDCLDLPDKIYNRLYLEMSPDIWTIYKHAKNKILELDSGKDLTIALNGLTTMRSITSGFLEDRYLYEDLDDNPKIKAVKDILEDHRREKAIIFVSYIREGHMLSEALQIPFYCGELSAEERSRLLEQFKTNKEPHLIATLHTLGTGHDLHMANVEIFYSNDFSYLMRSQAEDRCHRIGQKKSVHIYDLVFPKTIDAKILKVLEHKNDVAKVILQKGIEELI